MRTKKPAEAWLALRSPMLLLVFSASVYVGCRNETSRSAPVDRANGEGAYAVTASSGGGLRASNPAQHASIQFLREGVKILPDLPRALPFAWRLDGVGDAQQMAPVKVVEPSAHAARVEYLHEDGIREWYVNGPGGIEQGFDISRRPIRQESQAPLLLQIRLDGVKEFEAQREWVSFRVGESSSARLANLSALDARGQRIQTWFEKREGSLFIALDDRAVTYPIAIDPTLTLGTETQLSGAAGEVNFGSEIAVEREFAVVAALASIGGGKLYVFRRETSGWVDEQRILSPDSNSGNRFGGAVAVSGSTIAVGCSSADEDSVPRGAVYVYSRSGTTSVFVQKLSVPGASYVGQTVAIEGDTLLVGSAGRAFAFVRSNGLWTQRQTLEPPPGVPQDGNFGAQVTFRGNLAVVGRVVLDVFTKTGGTWTFDERIVPPAGGPFPGFGESFAISRGDLLVGASGTGGMPGSVFVFARTSAGWSHAQTLRGFASASEENFGFRVVATDDFAVIASHAERPGDSVLGAAHLFTHSGQRWEPRRSLLVSSNLSYSIGRTIGVGADSALVLADPLSSGTAPVVFAYSPALGRELADSCARAIDCASGFCVDGVCCNRACDGQCDACDVSTSRGTCAPASGSPPHGTRPSCGGFVCGATTCLDACTGDLDCAPTSYCAAPPQCTPKHPPGTACTAARECASGFCTDGVCCDTACSGQCEACNVPSQPGTCTPVTGAPRGARAACAAGDATCGPSCRDDRTRCTVASNITRCSSNTCREGVETHASLCDGNGKCDDRPRSCGGYTCEPTACKVGCAGPADCASGYDCVAAKCEPRPVPKCSKDGLSSIAPDQAIQPCSPYRCDSSGLCARACVSSAECIAGFNCDIGTKTCAPSNLGPTEDGGTGCAISRTASQEGTFERALVFIMAIVLIGRRRANGSAARRVADMRTTRRGRWRARRESCGGVNHA